MAQRTPSSFTAPLDRPVGQVYAFAALMVLLALGVRRAIDPFAQDAAPLATMYIAVAFGVWYGGWKPAALIATVGFFASVYWFMPPRLTFKSWGELATIRTTLYTVSCTITIYLCESIRRARRRHAASETKVVSILENMREGFCAVGPDWKIRALNRSVEQFLGQPREALIGRSLWEVLPNRSGTLLDTELRRAMRDVTAVQFETNAFVPGAWHAVTATHVNRELALFFHDITATRAHVDQLERLVDDRTAALQRIVTDLEAFSYTLVHDMRAPLRSISGFSELLATDHASQLDAEGRRHLERIQRSATNMDRLIVDILAYSQLSRQQPEMSAIDLDACLREILKAHADFQPDKASIEIETPLPLVRGNGALLNQCFSNLLHNAVKFVAPGVKPRIRIGAHLNGDLARIEIRDNGIGIAPEATLRVFEPFRRENVHYEGTGVGLAIVQKVVDQLGGRVGVESQLGHGSLFWVELKRASTAAATPRPATP